MWAIEVAVFDRKIPQQRDIAIDRKKNLKLDSDSVKNQQYQVTPNSAEPINF